jgi:hypothetical protein
MQQSYLVLMLEKFVKQFKKFAGALLCHVRPILIRRSLALLEFVCSTHSLNRQILLTKESKN